MVTRNRPSTTTAQSSTIDDAIKAVLAQNEQNARLLAQLIEEKKSAKTRKPGQPVGTISPAHNYAWAITGDTLTVCVNIGPDVQPDANTPHGRLLHMRAVKGAPEYRSAILPGGLYFSASVGTAGNESGPIDTLHKGKPQAMAARLLGVSESAIADMLAVWRSVPDPDNQ